MFQVRRTGAACLSVRPACSCFAPSKLSRCVVVVCCRSCFSFVGVGSFLHQIASSHHIHILVVGSFAGEDRWKVCSCGGCVCRVLWRNIEADECQRFVSGRLR